MERRRTSADDADRAAEDRVAAIYERHAAKVAAYAVRRASSTDAADAVAETFLVVWRRHDDVPDEPKTLPWLYGVTRRVLANQRRTDRRRGRLRDRLASEFARHDIDPPPFDEMEEFRRVAAAMRRLSDDDAELLRLTAWEALTPTEIAMAMGIEPATARQRLRRARQRLRRELDAGGRGPAAEREAADRDAPTRARRRGHGTRTEATDGSSTGLPSPPGAAPRDPDPFDPPPIVRAIRGGVGT